MDLMLDAKVLLLISVPNRRSFFRRALWGREPNAERFRLD